MKKAALWGVLIALVLASSVAFAASGKFEMTVGQTKISDGNVGCSYGLSAIGVEGDMVYAVLAYDNNKVGCVNSADGGETWEHLKTIDSSVGNIFSDQPNIAVVNSGGVTTLHVTWGINDGEGSYGRYSRSTDHGSTWSSPLGISGSLTDVTEYGVTVAADTSGMVFAFMESGNQGKMYANYSSNGGLTWQSSPYEIVSGRYGAGWMKSNGDPMLVYYNENNIYFTSCDISATECDATSDWSTPYMLGTDACEAHIATYGANTLYISCGTHFWKSTDNGASWSSPSANNPNDAYTSSVAVDSSGNVHLAWGEQGIYYAKSTNGGNTWSQTATVAEYADPTISYPRCANLAVDSNDTPMIGFWDLAKFVMYFTKD